MRFDAFTFTVTLINQLESRSIIRHSCEVAKRGSVCHPGPASFCIAAVWVFGRCFCITPLVRSFDEFDRLSIALLEAQGLVFVVSRGFGASHRWKRRFAEWGGGRTSLHMPWGKISRADASFSPRTVYIAGDVSHD